MAAGERTTAREPTDKFCPEIQRVAANYERVHARGRSEERRHVRRAAFALALWLFGAATGQPRRSR